MAKGASQEGRGERLVRTFQDNPDSLKPKERAEALRIIELATRAKTAAAVATAPGTLAGERDTAAGPGPGKPVGIFAALERADDE